MCSELQGVLTCAISIMQFISKELLDALIVV
jgi:hypothetical protein